MLKEAKTVCEHLICAVQSDPTVDRPKKNKPVQTLSERIAVLEAIRYVDEIVAYETESELYELLKTINPDIRILGTDYKDKEITGQDLGIEIYWHNRNHDWSTSKLRERIWREECQNRNEVVK
jgi:glycerol-3-phosphate cytidylyltransferase